MGVFLSFFLQSYFNGWHYLITIEPWTIWSLYKCMVIVNSCTQLAKQPWTSWQMNTWIPNTLNTEYLNTTVNCIITEYCITVFVTDLNTEYIFLPPRWILNRILNTRNLHSVNTALNTEYLYNSTCEYCIEYWIPNYFRCVNTLVNTVL